jgi:hypothetical protein
MGGLPIGRPKRRQKRKRQRSSSVSEIGRLRNQLEWLGRLRRRLTER